MTIQICLITPHHISFQPRTLREADSLYNSGCEVRVVSRQTDSLGVEFDQRLMRTRKWRLQTLNLAHEGRYCNSWFLESLFSKFFTFIFKTGLRSVEVAMKGYVKGLSRLTSLAAEEPADWFIAHTQGALPVATLAAERWNARLGFDCEDLLTERGTDWPEAVHLIEKNYLPHCDYISVPSEHIGNRLAEDYGVREWFTLYNVFPLHLARRLVPPERRSARPTLRLHWFGQTLGSGRGIEEAVTALGFLSGEAELHLRGRISEAYRATLEDLARNCGVSTKVIFHHLLGPDEIITSMSEFDVGLALERPDNRSTSQTVSNKLFSYLLAGLAVAASDTPGQQEVLEKIPAAGFLYPAGNPLALADKLRKWIGDRGALRGAQQAAWDAARKKFCWDIEKEKFLRIFKES